MINGKSVIAIIPARKGSKGLPGKNIKVLCGKPLISWSIEAGLASNYLDEVMVTTDCEDIANVSRVYGASVPFIRPSELATDTSTSFDAIKHTIEYYEDRLQKRFDYVVLLETTSPMREPGEIDRMLEKMISLEQQYDAIVTLGEVHEHPAVMKKVKGNHITAFCKDLAMAPRRQDNEIAYFPYGVGYIVKTETLLNEKSFYPRRTTYHVIKRYQCYEIDDIYDFLAVENIMKFEWNIK